MMVWTLSLTQIWIHQGFSSSSLVCCYHQAFSTGCSSFQSPSVDPSAIPLIWQCLTGIQLPVFWMWYSPTRQTRSVDRQKTWIFCPAMANNNRNPQLLSRLLKSEIVEAVKGLTSDLEPGGYSVNSSNLLKYIQPGRILEKGLEVPSVYTKSPWEGTVYLVHNGFTSN